MIKENVSLKNISSFRVGGMARWFAEPSNVDAIIELLEKVKKEKLPFRIVGDGTNILWSDDIYNGLILRPRIMTLRRNERTITIGAGACMVNVVDLAATSGLSGLEWAGGLPGSAGGALRGNAGAFKGEMKDHVLEVVSLDTETYKIRRRTKEACAYEYRSSVFKKENGKEIIIEATLALEPGDGQTIRETIDKWVAFRKERHPLEYPTAGSTFKNVPVEAFTPATLASIESVIKNDPFPVIPAGYLIEHAGMKGYRVHGAMISEKHSNFIVNVHEATAADIKELIARVRNAVREKFGVTLEEEIIIF